MRNQSGQSHMHERHEPTLEFPRVGVLADKWRNNVGIRAEIFRIFAGKRAPNELRAQSLSFFFERVGVNETKRIVARTLENGGEHRF